MREATETQAPIIDPKTGWNRLMVEQMTKSIRIAHEMNPRSWCIHTWNDQPVLSVGFVTSGSVGPVTPYGLVIDSHELDPELAALVEQLKDARTYKDRPWAIYVLVPGNEVEGTLELLRNPHEAAIRRLAGEVKSIANRWRDHREDFRREFERTIGGSIPEPGYLAELNASEASKHTSWERRYWKVSPGRDSSEWTTFRERGLVAMHYSDAPVDLSALPQDREGFRTELAARTEMSAAATLALWRLAREIREDDGVLAYGNRTILGHGRVTGKYEYGNDDFSYRHRRPVRWHSLDPRPTDRLSIELQNRLSQNATLVELTEAEFMEAVGESNDVQARSVDSSLDALQQHYAAENLRYSDTQIATFYTALQTKGFVVLSGISGTGKSKIAQGFVDTLPNPDTTATHIRVCPEEVITRDVQAYMVKKGRILIPSQSVGLLPPLDASESIYCFATLLGVTDKARVYRRIRPRGDSEITLVLQGRLRDAIARLEVGSQLYVVPVDDASGEGLDHIHLYTDASELPASYLQSTSESSMASSNNHLFLSVRPDWRDSTSLLGYYNPLTETYEWTDFLRFLLRAVESYNAEDGLAWFVILDEMNLAHVEYYFADLLSVIESGRDGRGMSREPLRLTYPDTLIDDAPPREVYLPPNLYIIGTVNMDETTHAFSPKVLDRAFTIELTDVDFRDYPGAPGNESVSFTEAERHHLLRSFTRDKRFAVIDKEEIAAIVEAHPEIRDWLQSLNGLLMRDRFHFGYRVFDEIAQFVANAEENGMLPFEEAFDHAVFMKVLPKFTGSLARLRSPLLSVLAWAINPDSPDPRAVDDQFLGLLNQPAADMSHMLLDARFPHVAGRSLQMLKTLQTDGFVSFG